MRMPSAAGVSVIICCYNSAARLPATLKHIALQNVPSNIGWELVIIDNNSIDTTTQTASYEWKKYSVGVPFKIVTEPRQGLIYAREKAVAEANYELLLFCDDDNWLEENYVRYAFEIMNANDNIAILGGRSEGSFETEKPLWFERFEKAYAIGKPLPGSGIANTRAYIAGAGMVIRKSVFQLLYKLGFKPLLTGRKGNQLLSGEDSEISLLTLFLGYDLYYDERLEFIHYIPAKRLSWNYCVSMISKGHAIPQVYFEFYNYCYSKMKMNETIAFKDAYNVIAKRSVKRALKNFSPVLPSMKSIIKTRPGSKKEIEVKSALNKVIYIVTNKDKLHSGFNNICAVLFKIKEFSYVKHSSSLQ